jgi:ubiquinone/menaquinone biosynthesis C-methylase UbiE
MSTMPAPDSDKHFAGSIPELYDQYMVPLIFERYAADLVQRLASRPVTRVLEIAAGTGVVTRKLASVLHEDVAIVATDLNPAMLETAAAIGTSRPVQWRQADAMQLPFANGMFDAVVCQFGVMFFPDKAKAFAEVGRVLCPGGVFIFNVWDRIEANEFADTVTTALAAVFPDDPPRFMARTPHGYHDRATIARDLADGGFTAVPRFDTLTARSRAESARDVAVAYCQGTPLRNEIEARDASRLDEATEAAAQAIARRFGGAAVEGRPVEGPPVEGRAVEGMIQAHVVAVARS